MRFLAGMFPLLAATTSFSSAGDAQQSTIAAAAAAKVNPALVAVQYSVPAATPPDRTGEPSRAVGVVVDPKGVVIANAAGLQRGPIHVVLADGSRLPAKLVVADPKIGVAVLKVETDERLSFAAFADSAKLELGDMLLALGAGTGLQSCTVSRTLVSKKYVRPPSGNNVLQLDFATASGPADAIVINFNGDVVGLLRNDGGVSFAIPSNQLRRLVTGRANEPSGR